MEASAIATLGWAYIASLWQVGLLWLLYTLALPKDLPSAKRQQVGRVIIMAALGLFVFNLCSGPSIFHTHFEQPTTGGNAGWRQALWQVAGLLYLILLAWGIVRSAYALLQLRQIRHIPLAKAPVDHRLFVQKMQAYMGIGRKVVLHLYEGTMPFTQGWLRPAIYLPASCVTGLSTRQVEALLLHELAHIMRQDYVWNLILQAAETVLWANPFVHLLTHANRHEGEKACDQWVLQMGYSPTEYSYALLSVARQNVQPALVPAATGATTPLLLLRIEYMLRGRTSSKTARYTWWMAGATACLLSLPLLTPPSQPLANNLPTGYAWETKKMPATQGNTSRMLSAAQLRQQLEGARMAILVAAIGSNPYAASALPKPIKMAPPTPEQGPYAGTSTSSTEENTGTIFENTAVIDAVWAGNQQPLAPTLQHVAALYQLKALLEQLGAENDLDDAGWQQLIVLMAHYTDLRIQLYGDANAQEEEGTVAQLLHTRDEDPKILMVEYDTQSGTLKAGVATLHDLPAHFRRQVNQVDAIPVLLIKEPASPTKGGTKL